MARIARFNGFTLIELIVVIVVVVILASFAISRWPGDVITTTSEAGSLAANLRYAQSLSIATNSRYRVNLTSNSQYQILNSSGAAVSIPSVAATTIVLPSTIKMSTSPATSYLIFDSQGAPYSGTTAVDTGTALASNLTITLTGINGATAIIVTPETGRISEP